MTLAFSFGGWALLDHASNVPLGKLIAGAFVVVLGVGLTTSVIALRGLLLRPGHKSVDEQDVFHKGRRGGERSGRLPHSPATHQWLIWQKRAERNQARAAVIRRGQQFFVGFLSADPAPIGDHDGERPRAAADVASATASMLRRARRPRQRLQWPPARRVGGAAVELRIVALPSPPRSSSTVSPTPGARGSGSTPGNGAAGWLPCPPRPRRLQRRSRRPTIHVEPCPKRISRKPPPPPPQRPAQQIRTAPAAWGRADATRSRPRPPASEGAIGRLYPWQTPKTASKPPPQTPATNPPIRPRPGNGSGRLGEDSEPAEAKIGSRGPPTADGALRPSRLVATRSRRRQPTKSRTRPGRSWRPRRRI